MHVTEEDWPEDLCAIPAEIPTRIKIQEVTLDQLPRGWRRFPAPATLQRFGDAWLQSGEMAVLAVPSAVIPIEKNYLLNPSHPEMKSIQIGAPQRCQLDFGLHK
jgi:RES domain-containing protein